MCDLDASYSTPISRFARKFSTKPNNSVLLELNIAEPIRGENKISAADPAPSAFTQSVRDIVSSDEENFNS